VFWIFVVLLIATLMAVFLYPKKMTVNTEDTFGRKTGTREVRTAKRVVVACLCVLTFGALAAASLSSVPTRNQGIVTTWGNKPTGRITGAGIKVTWPWENIEDWKATSNQFDHLNGDGHDGCVWVNIASGRRMCVAVQIEWKANKDQAVENFQDYKQYGDYFSRFVQYRVNPAINGALTSVFADFDPLAGVTEASPNIASPDFNKLFRDKLTTAINTAVGKDVAISHINFEAPTYDQATQGAIADYGKKVLEGRNLAVDKANGALRNQIKDQTGVTPAQQQCFDIAKSIGSNPGTCISGGTALVQTK